ncbi:MAG: class I SAM-dependent methyltransferase [Rhodobacteraceae bacterium]|nr:class I SAM-dependent methyltransferase [Paracoccaceae bacterium]
MSFDPETVALYDAKAADYELVQSDDSHAPLEAFIEALPKGGTALDLGCGPANAAARMQERGLVVTAIDPSQKMAALAKRKFGVKVTVGSFDDVTGFAEYDGIWASFSLLHAPRADMPRYLDAIHRALKPRGIFYIGMKTGTGTKRDSLGRLYTYYTETELHDLLTSAGFTILNIRKGAGAGLDGVVAPWITMDAHA